MTGTCYIVATPIGNLKDITLRALETLKEVDVVACEDTRHTKVLLKHYEINKPLISYYKHKEKQGAVEIINLLKEGKNVAVVSDAGMPCISDPGAVLVQALRKENISITVLPGASAITAAVALSGIDSNFTFVGFLSEKKKDRENLIKSFKDTPTALVIYSSPHDIIKNLQFLYEILGERKVHIVKEITKIFEKVVSGKLGEVELENTKGEYVIIVEEETEARGKISDDEIKQALIDCIEGGLTKKDAIKTVCQEYDISKNKVYSLSLDI